MRIRAHLAEFGIVAPIGRNGVEHLLNISLLIAVTNGYPTSRVRALPRLAPSCGCSRLIMAWYRSNEASKRLDDIPEIGPALATALVRTTHMCQCIVE